MIKIFVLVLVLSGLVKLNLSCCQTSSGIVWRDENYCGVNSAFVMVRLCTTRRPEYCEFLAELSPSNEGSSIGELQKCMGKFGLTTKVEWASPNDLSKITFPAIFFMEPKAGIELGHFNVVLEIKGRTVKYLDGTTIALTEEGSDLFFKNWSGAVVYPSPRKVTPVVIGILCGFFAAFLFLIAKRTKRINKNDTKAN